ncbi:isopentenyl-diphosphate Delta-isomerase [Mucilaginibacter sp. JRF]|nr:isopentenyl-diphosphate Delta-isomerase [Mucilaginibacter sp. JRF]
MLNEMENVILVDSNDNETGVMEKMEAHHKGVLHRAFSVILFNSKGELLLQKRADGKYHSAGLWSNTCCSHPRPGEGNLQAAERRLMEEMGITCPLTEAFTFTYQADLGDGLHEHEFDHVFIGNYSAKPDVNPDEVADHIYMAPEMIAHDLDEHPEEYTYWFKILYEELCARGYIGVDA